jgi:competence protein ComEC
MRSIVAAVLAVLTAAAVQFTIEAASATTPRAGEMNAHFINVGQGASVLLEFACGAALIDTGGEKNSSFDSTQRLNDYLDAFFARRTDLRSTLAVVILSHPHIDHTRGLPTVLKEYTVQTLVDDGMETGSGGRQQKAAHKAVRDSGGAMKHVEVTQRNTDGSGRRVGLPAGTLRCATTAPEFTFLWGALDARDGWLKAVLGNENNSSVVTRVKFGNSTMLFLGDLEEDVQSDLIATTCPGGISDSSCLLNVDLYHAAHHGSHNGTTEELVEAMSPRAAVISMGPFNRRQQWSAYQYGHPRDVAFDRLTDSMNGVSDSRPSISAMIARRGRSRDATGPQFSKRTFTKAVYGTGWPEDDNIVVAAKASGAWTILSQVTP